MPRATASGSIPLWFPKTAPTPGYCRRSMLPTSIQRLDMDQPAVVVDEPDRDRAGGIVDPGLAVHGEGLGQGIGGELLGLRIEAQIVPAVELAGPEFGLVSGSNTSPVLRS